VQIVRTEYQLRYDGHMDPLSDLLFHAGLHATVFSRAVLRAPVGVSTRGSDAAALFHVVVRGALWVRVGDDEPPVALRAGDLAVLPRGSAHVLSDPPDARPVPLSSWPVADGDGLRCVLAGEGGPETRILCGSFRFGAAARRWLLPHLPALLVVRGDGSPMAAFLDATLRALEHEAERGGPGADLVVARLSEVLLVQVLRAWARSGAPGWLAALSDPQLGRLLAAVHEAPARSWSADEMARCAGVSRSVLFDRFQEVLGQPPASWLAAWRMTLAADLLRSSDASVGEVAGRVGYASEASFVRAFRRHHGTTPGRLRAGGVESASGGR
jgi:AraC-like DNA-binding protein